MNKRYYLFILTLTCSTCFGQNLVTNPSFEDTVTCPGGPDQLNDCYEWSSYSESPDYMNSCATSSSMGVPYNWGGYQQAASGNAYAALAGFFSGWMGSNRREFIGGHLTQTLTIGTKYYVSFKISLTIKSSIMANCACNKMGAMFSTVPYSVGSPLTVTNNPPVYSDSLVTDTVNWTRIFGSFVADSAYDYIVIGNFFSNNNTDTLVIDNYDGYNLCYGAYYYVDDICVSTDSLNCNLLHDGVSELDNNEFSLFPNPFHDGLNITSRKNEELKLILYDVTCRKVLQQSFRSSITHIAEQLANGIYIYVLKTQNGIIATGKVIKQ